ncbi:GNAT family N-acetyltransferase [Pseudomonas sp. SWRI77]|uniref:GNAT family N-acetyltransferase n=1 Tax=Pseudomonas sp. SWRI77 TaxID=2745485 RepID=UPI0016478EE7|nr:GNAT family N-acetyltransferase [Pseudomonas sp. SWRI77]MBC3483766.1 GNAT family N-acetyltransferase [Pseudomonas sp. SWRI77]
MPQIDWLENHMNHCDTFAQWIHQQFQYEFEDIDLAQWQLDFAQGQGNGQWQCLVALDQGHLLGGAALAKEDLPSRPELGPWLACVFVHPAARGAGIAEQLIEGICTHARGTGVETLYLHTSDKQAYYAKRGWAVIEQFEAWGKAQWLMSRSLR